MGNKMNGNGYQKYVAANYIVSECNKNAWKVCVTLVDSIGEKNNPLILYGASGTGKSHLAHCVIEMMQQKGHTALHLSAFDFIEQLVDAITNHRGDDFRHDLVNYDILTIDDIQHFIGRMGCQGELGVIFDKRILLNKPTVLTSSEHPIQFSWLDKQLESRLLSGIMVKLELADSETQIQILKQRLDRAGMTLPYGVMLEAVNNTRGNGWIIDGVAKQLIDMAERGENITEDTITEVLHIEYSLGKDSDEKEIS